MNKKNDKKIYTKEKQSSTTTTMEAWKASDSDQINSTRDSSKHNFEFLFSVISEKF